MTNYEFDQRWVLALHPGEADVTSSWPTVEIWRPEPFAQGNGKNPESTTLGDLDGDGNIDAAGAHGFSDLVDFEGSAPGVHVVWGPDRDRVLDADAWTDGGWVPSTVDVGHPQWIVTQTDDELIMFRNDGGRSPAFDTVRLPKPPSIAFRSRPVRLADMDRDGDLDIVGMLNHEDSDLPEDKASVFVLINEGRPFDVAGWRLLPVKWGSGTTMLVSEFGEKWDQADISDLDGDGDLDIVANNEEWWAEPKGEVAPFFTDGLAISSVAVVWFENALSEAAVVRTEQDSSVRLEAEAPSRTGDSTWVERAPVRGDDSAAVAMQAFNGLTPPDGVIDPEATAGISFDVDLDGGNYTVWTRLWAPSAWAPSLGADTSDSAWLTVNGGSPLVVGDRPDRVGDAWSWERLAEPVRLSSGRHQVTLRVREHGVAVDEIILSRNPDFGPDD